MLKNIRKVNVFADSLSKIEISKTKTLKYGLKACCEEKELKLLNSQVIKLIHI